MEKVWPAHVDDLDDAQAVLLREREVAFVVAGHAHDRTLAVGHEHVVADPDLDLLAGERMGDEQARGHALLLHGGDVRLHDAAALALFDERRERRIVARGMGRERMLGRHGAEGDAHQRVGARGEDLEQPAFAVQLVGERDVHALALADPVGLHELHALGPAGQRVERAEQFLGVARDLHVVHRDLALLDHRAGAPAAPVDHLLVGEHGLVDRIPVHHAGLAIDDALLEHAQEQPLVPPVVLGPAGGDLALPVQGEPERLELLLHVRDVVVRPLGRRHAVGHRRVLGRQAEGVPAHGLEHVVPAHAMEAREHVADGVVAHVAHVQLPRRIGKHRQAVVLRLARLLDGARTAGGGPCCLRGTLHVRRVVLRLHRCH